MKAKKQSVTAAVNNGIQVLSAVLLGYMDRPTDNPLTPDEIRLVVEVVNALTGIERNRAQLLMAAMSKHTLPQSKLVEMVDAFIGRSPQLPQAQGSA